MDSTDYLQLILGHFLNSTEYHVARLEKDYTKYGDAWLKWNQTYLKIENLPVEISPKQYEELKSIYRHMAKKLKGLESIISTTFPLLLKINIDKTASVNQDGNENGWHFGQTIWHNFKALIEILKLHLKELRSEYTKFLNGGYADEKLVVSMNKKFKKHFIAMRELILNLLSDLEGKLNELVLAFEDDEMI
jgi:hypothetical protein